MVDEFSATQTTGNPSTVQLWKAFHHMTSGLTAGKKTDNEEHYPFQEILKHRNSAHFCEEIIKRGRNYLERITYEATLSRARSDSRTDLTLSEQVLAVIHYTKSQLSRHKNIATASTTKLHGFPVWALIFYSLRLGALKTAADFANEGDNSTISFAAFLVDYYKNHGRLSLMKEKELQTMYSRQGAALNEDVFKKASFAILSRSDPTENFASIIYTVSDWLWFKLAQAESSGKAFPLTFLQQLVREKFGGECGEEVETFLVHVLTGQFEDAIEKLFHNANLRSHAIHMTIALKNANLFLISSNVNISEINDASCRRLDIVSLIKKYVREFRKQNPETAIEYYFHLSDIPARIVDVSEDTFENAFEFCVFELAMDTKNLSKLFGSMDVDVRGTIRFSRGLVHKFFPQPERLMVAVAKKLEDNGQFEEAVILYETAKESKLSMDTLLRELCHVLNLSANDPIRKNVQRVAMQSAIR